MVYADDVLKKIGKEKAAEKFRVTDFGCSFAIGFQIS